MKTDIDIPPHGGQLRRIAERFGVPLSGLLDFSANINPEGPSASAVQALHEALRDPTVLSEYPDLEETQLRLSISEYAGVVPQSIIVANGFVPLLDAVLRAFPIRRCLLPVPSFGEYRNALERAGIAVTAYVLDQEKDFRYQPDDLVAELTTGHYDSILLANPQNPSGVLCERENLVALIEKAAKLGVHVLLDEAFIDYCSAHSLAGEVERFPNLSVFRSVTKFQGVPGLRVAYAIANGSVQAEIRRSVPPWSITTLAAIAIRAALADKVHAERTLQLNDDRRGRLIMALRALGLYSYPSAANFLLIRFSSAEEAQNCWQHLIVETGIVLRNCTNFEGLTHNHLRCAVRDDRQHSRLIEALKARR